MAPLSKQQKTAPTTTTIFNEFHATSYSYLVNTISKNAILGWTIIFTINGYKQTLTHTKKKERKKRREGKRKTKEKKENC